MKTGTLAVPLCRSDCHRSVQTFEWSSTPADRLGPGARWVNGINWPILAAPAPRGERGSRRACEPTPPVSTWRARTGSVRSVFARLFECHDVDSKGLH